MAIVPFPNYNVMLWCSNLTELQTALGISLLALLNWIKEHHLFSTEFPLNHTYFWKDSATFLANIS